MTNLCFVFLMSCSKVSSSFTFSSLFFSTYSSAPKPARSTFVTTSFCVIFVSSYVIVKIPVVRFTLLSETPSSFLVTRSTALLHAAHVIPDILYFSVTITFTPLNIHIGGMCIYYSIYLNLSRDILKQM